MSEREVLSWEEFLESLKKAMGFDEDAPFPDFRPFAVCERITPVIGWRMMCRWADVSVRGEERSPMMDVLWDAHDDTRIIGIDIYIQSRKNPGYPWVRDYIRPYANQLSFFERIVVWWHSRRLRVEQEE